MGKITAIKEANKAGKKVGVYIDGKMALSVNIETALQEHLKPDVEVNSDWLADLKRKDDNVRCRAAAERLLAFRPRSERELQERLRRSGFTDCTIDSVIGRLKEQELVNDSVFAGFWKENREAFAPRSRYLTRLELMKKGVTAEIAEQTVSSIDDSETAYQIAAKRAARMTAADYSEFRKRLADFLKRRGFDYDTIKQTVEKVWKERNT